MSRRKVKISRPRTRRASTPVLKDRFTAVVRDLSNDGRGVVQAPDGQVVFVAGTWQVEEVEIERSRRGKSTSAELISLLQLSVARRTPECEYHREGSRGGCPLVFVDYSTQLRQKQARLSRALERINSNALSCSVLGANQALVYRNRAQFKSDGVKLGYVAQGSHEIADVTHCPVLNEVNQLHFRALRKSLPNRDWRPNLPNRDWRPSKNRQWTTIDIDDERTTPLVNQRQAFRQGNLTEVIAGQLDVPIIAIEGAETSLQALSARNLSKVQPVRVNLFSKHSIVYNMPRCQPDIGLF